MVQQLFIYALQHSWIEPCYRSWAWLLRGGCGFGCGFVGHHERLYPWWVGRVIRTAAATEEVAPSFVPLSDQLSSEDGVAEAIDEQVDGWVDGEEDQTDQSHHIDPPAGEREKHDDWHKTSRKLLIVMSWQLHFAKVRSHQNVPCQAKLFSSNVSNLKSDNWPPSDRGVTN